MKLMLVIIIKEMKTPNTMDR